MPTTWQAFYADPLIGTWGLATVAGVVLLAIVMRRPEDCRGADPRVAAFVRAWAVVFAVDAVLDPIATGVLGWPMLPFVLFGDYRVFLLVLVVMQPERSRARAVLEAAAWTLVVPATAYGLFRGLEAIRGPQPEAVLWLVYEVAFAALATGIAWRLVPARVQPARADVGRYLGAVAAMVILYYGLWAAADAVILSGADWGWALRLLPNLLYYGAFVPFAYWSFFATAPSVARSVSVQTAR